MRIVYIKLGKDKLREKKVHNHAWLWMYMENTHIHTHIMNSRREHKKLCVGLASGERDMEEEIKGNHLLKILSHLYSTDFLVI